MPAIEHNVHYSQGTVLTDKQTDLQSSAEVHALVISDAVLLFCKIGALPWMSYVAAHWLLPSGFAAGHTIGGGH